MKGNTVMNNFKRLVCLVAFSFCASSTLAETMPSSEGDYSQTRQLASGTDYGYGLHLPKNADKRHNMPLVVALHYGWGGEAAPLEYGYQFMTSMMSATFKNAIIIAPSALAQGWHNDSNTDPLFGLIEDIKDTYSINDNRVLLTGYSAGGFGAWSIGADYQDEFTAIMPISGAPLYFVNPVPAPQTPQEYVAALDDMPKINTYWDIPVYVIHSNADLNVPIHLTNNYIDELKDYCEDENITYVTLDGAAHFDFAPFLVEAKKGYKIIKKMWKNQY
jgi:predicted peptidase